MTRTSTESVARTIAMVYDAPRTPAPTPRRYADMGLYIVGIAASAFLFSQLLLSWSPPHERSEPRPTPAIEFPPPPALAPVLPARTPAVAPILLFANAPSPLAEAPVRRARPVRAIPRDFRQKKAKPSRPTAPLIAQETAPQAELTTAQEARSALETLQNARLETPL
jgi:hypothetical protein